MDSAWTQGDHDKAWSASKTAKWLNVAGIISGALSLIVVIVIVIAVVVFNIIRQNTWKNTWKNTVTAEHTDTPASENFEL